MKQLDAVVYPSDIQTIAVQSANDIYGGAHRYIFKNCLGFVDGATKYEDLNGQVIQFVQKLDNGDIIPGLQSEQIVYALIDRQKKLNARFPSPQNDKALKGLEMFIEAQRERVEDRVNRGVMGNLAK